MGNYYVIVLDLHTFDFIAYFHVLGPERFCVTKGWLLNQRYF